MINPKTGKPYNPENFKKYKVTLTVEFDIYDEDEEGVKEYVETNDWKHDTLLVKNVNVKEIKDS